MTVCPRSLFGKPVLEVLKRTARFPRELKGEEVELLLLSASLRLPRSMTPSEPPSSMRRVAPPPPVVKLKNAAINGIDGEQHSRVSSSKTTTSNISVRNANSSWLLRLFQSEFFDSRLALCYLFRYPESVGMHHYICDQLKNFDLREIEFLLPQLWCVFCMLDGFGSGQDSD